MKRSYLIVGTNGEYFQRSIVNGVKSKLEAMKNFLEVYPKALIISACRLEEEEKNWLNQNNMPECENVVLKKER